METIDTNTIPARGLHSYYEDLVVPDECEISSIQVNWRIETFVHPFGINIEPSLISVVVLVDGDELGLDWTWTATFEHSADKGEGDLSISLQWAEIDFKDRTLKIYV